MVDKFIKFYVVSQALLFLILVFLGTLHMFYSVTKKHEADLAVETCIEYGFFIIGDKGFRCTYISD